MRKVLLFTIFVFLMMLTDVSAEPWPIEECGRQGIFQTFGQPQTASISFCFHDGVDIVSNENADKVLVRCVRSGWLFWLHVDETGKDEGEDVSEIYILVDTPLTDKCFETTLDVYGHVVPTDEIKRMWNAEKRKKNGIETFNPPRSYLHYIEAGEIIGHVCRDGETGYGSNAAPHVHYAIYELERLWSCHWNSIYSTGKILINPMNLLDNAVDSDNTPPIFLNISDTNPDLGYPIDIVDDSSDFDSSVYKWDTYRDTEGDPDDHYDNINKTRWPWRVKGKVDIWARAIDFMNAKGTFSSKWTGDFDPFDIYPVPNKIKYDIKDSEGNSIFNDSQLLINFNDYLPGKLKNELERPYKSVFAPWWDEGLQAYRDYPHPNIYVVTNTDGNGNPQTSGCWDTTTVPNGIYTIEVTVSDLNNNSATTTMTVEVLNADIYVDDDNYPGGTGTLHDPFGTITQAVCSASTGDMIYVNPGIYNIGELFPIEINKDGITINGSGIDETVVRGNFDSSIFVIKSDNVTINDMTITGSDYVEEPNFGAIVIDHGHGTIKNCKIYDNDSPGICLYWSSPDTLISNCLIECNDLCGIYCEHALNVNKIRNCTVVSHDPIGIDIEMDSFIEIKDCIIEESTYSGIQALTGSFTWMYNSDFWNNPYIYVDDGTCEYDLNYNELDPQHESSGSHNYYLNPNSGCVDAGSCYCSADNEICRRTTRADNAPFSSGIYDENTIDLGFHYPPVCQTAIPTPIPTPAPVNTCPPTPTPHPNLGAISVIKDYPNDLWKIQVTDPNLPLKDIPEVEVNSEADTTGFVMALPTQMGPDQYEQILGFAIAPTPSDPGNRILSVNDPDWVTIIYEDDSPVATVTYETGYSYGTPLPSPTPTPTTGFWTDTDDYGYTGTAPVTYSWIDATSGIDIGILEDDGYSDIDLPFEFLFYGQLYDSARISANGYLIFGENGSEFKNTGLPWQEEPNNAIYPFWEDIDPSQGGEIYTLTTGTAPNRQFIVEWHQVPFFNSSETVTFELILFESTDEILFQYYEMNGSRGTGISASVGIENGNGTIGLRYSSRFEPGTIYDGLAIQFVPPISTPTPISTATPYSGNYSEDFESGWEYWTANGLWHLVDDSVSNCPPTPGSHSPSKSWYYGRDDTCNYDTGDRNWGELISPLIDLTGTAYLHFWSWSEVEPGASDVLDIRAVFVSVDGGSNWEYCGQVTGDEAEWVEQGVMLSYISGPARIKFLFDTTDAENNDYRGWYVDDLSIEILTPTPTPFPLPATSPTGNILIIMVISIFLILGLSLTRKMINE